MFRYLINIFQQLRKIFGIKGILECIHADLTNETKSLEEFKHSMDLALGHTILAKQTGNKICSQDS